MEKRNSHSYTRCILFAVRKPEDTSVSISEVTRLILVQLVCGVFAESYFGLLILVHIDY
jgi:hypothetical protein